jgi:hypothetical protein
MRIAVATLAVLAVPNALLACPVCFGQNDSPLASAMNLGIFAMLMITVGVLVAFASFFIQLMRRARLASESDGDRPPTLDTKGKPGHYAPGAHGGVA